MPIKRKKCRLLLHFIILSPAHKAREAKITYTTCRRLIIRRVLGTAQITIKVHMSLLAQRYVLWTESLFREWAKWLQPDECRVLMRVCKRWRLLCFRPQFYFSMWRMPSCQRYPSEAERSFLVHIKSIRDGPRYLCSRWDWFGVISLAENDVRWVQNKRCKGRKRLTDATTIMQLRLFATGWGQLWPRILEVRTAEDSEVPQLIRDPDED